MEGGKAEPILVRKSPDCVYAQTRLVSGAIRGFRVWLGSTFPFLGQLWLSVRFRTCHFPRLVFSFNHTVLPYAFGPRPSQLRVRRYGLIASFVLSYLGGSACFDFTRHPRPLILRDSSLSPSGGCDILFRVYVLPRDRPGVRTPLSF